MARVVVTGMGTVVPGGIGKEAFWHTLIAGKPTYDMLQIERAEQFRS